MVFYTRSQSIRACVGNNISRKIRVVNFKYLEINNTLLVKSVVIKKKVIDLSKDDNLLSEQAITKTVRTVNTEYALL